MADLRADREDERELPRDSGAEVLPSAPERTARLRDLLRDPSRFPEVPTSELVGLLYFELKSVALHLVRSQRPGETLSPTVLVNEAYLRLVGTTDPGWEGRAHFFGAAARAMREVLSDYWRARKARKRGGDLERITLSTAHHPVLRDPTRFDDVNEALSVLEKDDPRAAEVVLHRVFLGFSVKETAEILGVSSRTVEREWAWAKAFLIDRLTVD